VTLGGNIVPWLAMVPADAQLILTDPTVSRIHNLDETDRINPLAVNTDATG